MVSLNKTANVGAELLVKIRTKNISRFACAGWDCWVRLYNSHHFCQWSSATAYAGIRVPVTSIDIYTGLKLAQVKIKY